MKGVFLSLRELDALEGLPFAAVAFYVMALRPLMDAATRTVGNRHSVSWARLALAINPAPIPGVPAQRVSRQQARRIGATLQRAGLVRITGSEVHRTLFFHCPLASELSLAQNQADTRPTQQADTPHTEVKQGLGRHSKKTQADTYLRTKNKTPPPQPPRDNPPENAPATVAKAGEGGILIYPEKLPPTAKQGLGRALEGLTNAQELLDELAARMAGGNIKSPAKYALKLIEQARQGVFIPEQAHLVREARERQAREAQREAIERAARPASTKGSGEAARARLRSMFKLDKRGTNAGNSPG